MSQPEPNPGNGTEGIGAPEAQAPEARLNRGPAFVPLAQTPRASEFGIESRPSQSEPGDGPDSEADTEDGPIEPKTRKRGLLERLRLRKKGRPVETTDAIDDETNPESATETDPEVEDENEDDDPDGSPRRRGNLSGRRVRVAAAVALSIAVLGGALAYPRVFPGSARQASDADAKPTEAEEDRDPDAADPPRESRQPVVAAIPAGRNSPTTDPESINPEPAAVPETLPPDPTTVVSSPPSNGVRLASATQPDPLDEPAPLPASTSPGLAPTGEEPTPLPADALAPTGRDLDRSRPAEPPSLDPPGTGDLPPPTEVPPPLPVVDTTPAAPTGREPSSIANTRVAEPPTLLDDPTPTPSPAASTPPTAFNPTPTPPEPTAAPAIAPPPSQPSAVDTGQFVEIPNTRKSRGAAIAGGAAVGSLAMATLDNVPTSRVQPLMDQPAPMASVVPESVEPILHRVGSGQNFQTISKYYYGTTRYWKALWSANRALVPAPELLAVGMTIKIPMADELDSRYVAPESPAVESGAEPTTIRSTPRTGRIQQSRFDPANDPPRRVGKPTYTVRRNGETLRSIARDILGDTSRAQEILDLNAERLDPAIPALKVGVTLRLPDDARPDQR